MTVVLSLRTRLGAVAHQHRAILNFKNRIKLPKQNVTFRAATKIHAGGLALRHWLKRGYVLCGVVDGVLLQKKCIHYVAIFRIIE